MFNEETDIPERLRAIWKRSGLSLEEIAHAAGFKFGSSIQRYVTPGMFTKKYLPIEIARRLAVAFKGLGEPPITEAEVLELAGVFKDAGLHLYVAQMFTEYWLKSKTQTHPKFLKLASVKDNGMAPTLQIGDDIMIDTSKAADQDGIYVLKVDHNITVKRLQILKNKTRILSDNQLYKPFEVNVDDLEIMGRVIWCGKKIE